MCLIDKTSLKKKNFIKVSSIHYEIPILSYSLIIRSKEEEIKEEIKEEGILKHFFIKLSYKLRMVCLFLSKHLKQVVNILLWLS